MMSNGKGSILLITAMAFGITACERPPAERPDFQFERLAPDGTPVAEDAAPGAWACLRDLRNGLLWEAKSTEPGLHSHDNTYTWYSEDEGVHFGKPGTRDGGVCTGSRCDTNGFLDAVNRAGLCGHHDWRIADRHDFMTINDPSIDPPGPRIPTEYFPLMGAREHWTSETYRSYPMGAWVWNTRYGHDRVDGKDQPKPVRLVRGTLAADDG